MAAKLALVSFGLPTLFPPELMPEAGAQFVASCLPGMTKADLLEQAKRNGWRPSWKPLGDLENGEVKVFGFGLTIDGMGVPLIARMRVRKVGRPEKARDRDPRQMSLF